MGDWGTKPWENDVAADWFMNMIETTGLAEYVEKTIEQELGDDDPGARADEIRAAVSVLVLLGYGHIWPVDDWENDLKLAISRLEEILPKDYSSSAKEQIHAEITVLKARLERKTDKHMEKAKWWHFDE
jgi:hypothetical protein